MCNCFHGNIWQQLLPWQHFFMFSFEFKTMHKPPKVGVDQIPTSISKPGTSKQNDLPSSHPSSHPKISASVQPDEPMEMDLYGPSLPPGYGEAAQSVHGPMHGSDPSLWLTRFSPKSTGIRENIKPGLSTYLLQRNQIPLFKSRSLPSPRGVLLSKNNPKLIQTQSFIGR